MIYAYIAIPLVVLAGFALRVLMLGVAQQLEADDIPFRAAPNRPTVRLASPRAWHVKAPAHVSGTFR